jgi:hypothetical protein
VTHRLKDAKELADIFSWQDCSVGAAPAVAHEGDRKSAMHRAIVVDSPQPVVDFGSR